MRTVLCKSAALVVLVLLSGCSPAVKIVAPAHNLPSYPPVSPASYTVQFDSDYKSGTFQAILGGLASDGTISSPQLFTGQFSPAGVPGGTSTAPGVASCFWARNPQVLHVSGDFQSSGILNIFKGNSDEVTFSPPEVQVVGPSGKDRDNNFAVREGETITAYVVIAGAPKEALQVKLTGDEYVSLNEAPVPSIITVPIPTNDRRAAFNVRGVKPGSFRIIPCAASFAPLVGGGPVNPR